MYRDAFQKKIVIQGFFAVAIIAALSLGLWYFGNTISTLSSDIATMRQVLASRSRALNTVAALRSDYRTRAMRALNVMYARVPTEEQLINLRQELQVLAAKNNVGLSYVFESDTAATPAGFGTYNFSIEATGDFDALVSFVGVLQNFRYLSQFQNYALTRASGKSSLRARGTIFFREEAADIPLR